MNDMILYDIYDISNNCYISDNKYFIDCYFYLDNNYMKSLSDLKIKLKEIGVIYGQISPDSFDINLTKVSHCIRIINGGLIELRKLKLKKIKGVIITNYHNVKITIEILNVPDGKIIKKIMNYDINIKLKTYLRCVKKIDDDEILKIFTVNIDT